MADKEWLDWESVKGYVLKGFFLIGGILILKAVDIINLSFTFNI